MPGLASELHRFATGVLGSCELLTPPGAGLDSPNIALVRDRRGGEYIAKRHATAIKHKREVHAYRRWVPALGASSARLVAADPQTLTVLLTALPGQPCHNVSHDADCHRQAGALLRLLHDAEPSQPLDGFQNWLDSRIGWWRRKAESLLTNAEKRIIDHRIAALRALETPPGGPCHFDFQPRNWLTSPNGKLSVIDFEHSRIGLQARDLTRLHFRYWASQPDLRDAFLSGYARAITPASKEIIISCGAIDALTALIRGAQTGDRALTSTGRATLAQLADRA